MRQPAGGAEVDAGFTLLELLIVIVLLGVIGAVAVPATKGMFDRWRVGLQRDDVEKQLADLGPKAFLEGRTIVLATSAPPVAGKAAPPPNPSDPKLDLPPGWRMVADPPIVYRADGVCMGGLVRLEADDQRFEYRLEGPRCRPR